MIAFSEMGNNKKQNKPPPKSRKCPKVKVNRYTSGPEFVQPNGHDELSRSADELIPLSTAELSIVSILHPKLVSV